MVSQIRREIVDALENRELEVFRELLLKHPEHLRGTEGEDYLLQYAVGRGWLEGVKCLTELGIDVNERPSVSMLDDPDDSFLQVEGPILWAAAKGHLEIARWLLDHGAKINFIVGGKPRCTSLHFAAQAGHLDLVRLLVERGADFQATNHGHNAISLAEDNGHWEVFDYLHGLGARTLRETTPRQHEWTHRRIRGTMRENRGSLSSWTAQVPGEPAIEIRLIPANELFESHTLFTVGLSDHPLPDGRWEHACCELEVRLPKDWPIERAMEEDPARRWPLEWLKQVASSFRTLERMPDRPILVMNGEPAVQLADGTGLCGWLVMPSPEGGIQAPDFRYVGIMLLFAIYSEEAEYVRRHGQEALSDRFIEAETQLTIDAGRANMALEADKKLDIKNTRQTARDLRQ